jgi:hypothetical protein
LNKLKEGFENSNKALQIYKEKYDASQSDKDQLIDSKIIEINDTKNKLSKIRSEYEELKTIYNNILEEKTSLEILVKEEETIANEIANHEKTKQDYNNLKR